MLAVDSVSAEGGSPVGVSGHYSPALSRARESPDNVRKMFGKCSELVGARARWASAMKEPTGTCSGNVRKMFGTGGCPLPCPSRGRGVPPTMFDSVRKMFGKCSENVRSASSRVTRPAAPPGKPALPATSASPATTGNQNEVKQSRRPQRYPRNLPEEAGHPPAKRRHLSTNCSCTLALVTLVPVV
jgi:hypothetical protein